MTPEQRIRRLTKRVETLQRLSILTADSIEDAHAALCDLQLALQGQQELVSAAPACPLTEEERGQLGRDLEDLADFFGDKGPQPNTKRSGQVERVSAFVDRLLGR